MPVERIDGGAQSSSAAQARAALRAHLEEAWRCFGTSVLWSVDRDFALDPTHAREIAEELRHGGREAFLCAALVLRAKEALDRLEDAGRAAAPDPGLAAYLADRETLEANGCAIEELVRPRPGFVRVLATGPAGDAIRVDQAWESTFRFFPVVPNPLTGWELHWVDAATNKVLAAGGRERTRDAFDLLHWHRNPLSLGALVWAAVGKDPGFSPDLLLDEIGRNARISPTDLAKLRVAGPFDPIETAARFREACREARRLVRALPPELVGGLFLDEAGEPIEPDPGKPETLRRIHRGSERGCWPSFPTAQDDPAP